MSDTTLRLALMQVEDDWRIRDHRPSKKLQKWQGTDTVLVVRPVRFAKWMFVEA